MVRSNEVIGRAVLRDFPLRLWARQQHTGELLREFNLLLLGQEPAPERHAAPGQLVALAGMFTRDFGALLDRLTDARQAAYDAGADRMDSVVPIPADLPGLLDQVRRVLAVVDEYCSRGQLLALQRSPELRALTDWTLAELVAQQEGAEPTPWPGPFQPLRRGRGRRARPRPAAATAWPAAPRSPPPSARRRRRPRWARRRCPRSPNPVRR